MRATTQHHRTPLLRAALALAAAGAAGRAAATDLPPEVVASFTQRVQPLLLNRCATGACHGSADSPAPRLRRGIGQAPPDQSHTRANLAAFLAAVGPARDPRPLAATLAAGHPADVEAPTRRAAPLSTPERVTLDRWLAQVRDAERAAIVDPRVMPASAEMPEAAPPRPNRFRALLDSAANPPDLPPPREPPGVIFKNDVPPDTVDGD
ncbi:MAG: hypothetical protein ACKOZU_01775 [Planctomycetaceae bacterium]